MIQANASARLLGTGPTLFTSPAKSLTAFLAGVTPSTVALTTRFASGANVPAAVALPRLVASAPRQIKSNL